MPQLCAYVLVFAMLAAQLQISGAWSALQQNPVFAQVIGVDQAEAQSLPPTFTLSTTDQVRAFANLHGANIPTSFDGMGQVRLDPPTLFKLCNLAGYSGVQSWNCTYPGENRCNFTSCGNNYLTGWNGSSWVQGGACGGSWVAQVTCNTPFVACNDGKDNDGDGKVDLQDPGCTSATDTDETDPKAQCSDGIDNDGDGATDFPADFSCSSATDNDETNPKAACQDGVDNDGDGKTDFPQDPGCVSKQDNDEFNAPAVQCQNGIDDDGDGRTDFPNDPGCSGPDDNTEGGDPACADRVDNDQDGLVDFPQDPGCVSLTDNDEFNAAPGQCTQQDRYAARIVNHSGVGFTSPSPNVSNASAVLGAPDRSAVNFDGSPGFVTIEFNTPVTDGPGADIRLWLMDFSTVTDIGGGAENESFTLFASSDGVNFVSLGTKNPTSNVSGQQVGIDFNINGLVGPVRYLKVQNNQVQNDNVWEGPDIDAFEILNCQALQCQDGIDNDGDGATDFPQDFSCSSPTDNDETNPKAACQDGLDNDFDGLVDFPQDPGCVSKQDNDEFNAPLPACRDGIDNDFDGRVDMQDPGCSHPDDTNEGDDPACADRVDNDNDGLIDFPFDPGCVNPQDTDEFNQVQTVDLSITKSGPAAVVRGQTIYYTIQIGNSGTLQASNVVVTDQIPAGLVYNDALSYGPCSQQGNAVTCSLGTLVANQFGSILLAFDTQAVQNCTVTNVVNVATISSSQTDSNQSNNTATTQLNPTRVDCPVQSFQCNDGFDNDGDGKIDFPADPGCVNAQDNDEFNAPAAQCQDGIDNDQDGRVDMQDPGCSSPTDTNEGDEAACQDLRDNDFDGKIDFPADPGCASPQDTDEFNQPLTQCQDGVDNDGDGRVDLLDPGCSGPTDTNEGDEAACQDRRDNDGDGLVDWPQDPGCVSAQDNDEFNAPLTQCQDGIDNDGDWRVDMQDPGCSSPADTNEGDDPACFDRVDNDQDGLVDFPLDPGCSSPNDTDESDPFVPQCQDGRDNDFDGKVDMQDPGCSSPTDTNEGDDPVQFGCIEITKETYDPHGNRLPIDAQFTFILDATRVAYNNAQGRARFEQVTPGQHAVAEIIPSGWTQLSVSPQNGMVTVTAGTACAQVSFRNRQVFVANAQCADGYDNDGDGLKDFPQDTGCSSATDNDEFNTAFQPQCRDGIDNDGDNLADFPQDPGCQNADDNNEVNGQPLVQQQQPVVQQQPIVQQQTVTGTACSDGIDNDGDGQTDLQDLGCSGSADTDEFNFRVARCSDGIDNDGDGLKDFPQDPGCTTPHDDNEWNNRFITDRWREWWNWNW